jgi:hypothetical protein
MLLSGAQAFLVAPGGRKKGEDKQPDFVPPAGPWF